MADHSVTRSAVIPASPEDVWEALTDPARLEDWFADEVEADGFEPDAEVVFRWDDSEERPAIVEEVDAPRRLTFRWRAGGDESHVAFSLEPERAGTRVTVVETGSSEAARTWAPRMRALASVAALALV